jgi:lysophospholipase L1-like esterase
MQKRFATGTADQNQQQDRETNHESRFDEEYCKRTLDWSGSEFHDNGLNAIRILHRVQSPTEDKASRILAGFQSLNRRPSESHIHRTTPRIRGPAESGYSKLPVCGADLLSHGHAHALGSSFCRLSEFQMHLFAGQSFCGRVLAVIAAGVLALPSACSDEPPALPAGLDLQDGDTFVFLGDSITHQRLYTQYVETFFYTRLPARRIRFHNAGVGGAKAWDALQRMQHDVTDFTPQYVSILLGMNDGRYQPFDRETFDTYQTDMNEVVRRVREAGAAPILMSPTMFDSRAASVHKRARPPGTLAEYNSVLAYYGQWLQHQAIESGAAYVDMYGPLNRITFNKRRKDANFTMIQDAVHPDPPGQVVMALAMIEQLGVGKPLSSIVVRTGGRTGPKARVAGGEISNLTFANGQVEFDWKANGLPWVLPADAQAGMKITRAGRRVSRESLRIVGLPPTKYEVVIDEVVVATCNADKLAQQLALQSNEKTPQYQQALAVALLNESKNKGPVGTLRNSWGVFQNYARTKQAIQSKPDDEALSRKLVDLETHMQGHTERVQAAQREIAEFEDQIYETNKPLLRHYVIRKVTK